MRLWSRYDRLVMVLIGNMEVMVWYRYPSDGDGEMVMVMVMVMILMVLHRVRMIVLRLCGPLRWWIRRRIR